MMRLNKTLQEINITEENSNIRRLTMEDLNLSCYYTQGTFIEEDVTCNSQFMIDIMPTISTQNHQ
jgi:hypothetical protein